MANRGMIRDRKRELLQAVGVEGTAAPKKAAAKAPRQKKAAKKEKIADDL